MAYRQVYITMEKFIEYKDKRIFYTGFVEGLGYVYPLTEHIMPPDVYALGAPMLRQTKTE